MCGPNSAADPGLVFDSGYNDWLDFLCGTQPGALLLGVHARSIPATCNAASIAIGDMPGAQTVTRRVTNVGAQAETYTRQLHRALRASPSPCRRTFTVAKGDERDLQLRRSPTPARR